MYVCTHVLMTGMHSSVDTIFCSCMKYFNDWTNLRRLYNYMVTRNQVALIRRHSNVLLNPSSKPTSRHSIATQRYSTQSQNTNSNLDNQLPSYPSFRRCHGDYDYNGIALEPSLIQSPDYGRLSTATGMLELDEYFSKRVCGFTSVEEMYK